MSVRAPVRLRQWCPGCAAATETVLCPCCLGEVCAVCGLVPFDPLDPDEKACESCVRCELAADDYLEDED